MKKFFARAERHNTWRTWRTSILMILTPPKKLGELRQRWRTSKLLIINNIYIYFANSANFSLCVILFKKLNFAKVQKTWRTPPTILGEHQPFFERESFTPLLACVNMASYTGKKKMSRAVSDTSERVYEILYMVDITDLIRHKLYLIVLQQLTRHENCRYFIPQLLACQWDITPDKSAYLGCQRTKATQNSSGMG